MPKTTEAHAGEMRQRILNGAHRAMLTGGYHGTSMPAIANQADVSVGLLYRYFDSKEELYLAMCESVTQAQLEDLAGQIAQLSDTRERLTSAISHFITSLEVEHWGAIVTTGWAEAELKPALREMLRRRCDGIRAFAARFLREAAERGEFPPEADIDELSLAAAMLLDGVIAHQAEVGDAFDPARAQRAVIGLLSRALGP